MNSQQSLNIGDIAIARYINPLLNYDGQIKQKKEGMPIDLSWNPQKYIHHFPKVEGAAVFVFDGDELEIISNDTFSYECPYSLFKVKDKEENQFWISSIYLTKKEEKDKIPLTNNKQDQ